jgi:hypothetical protein
MPLLIVPRQLRHHHPAYAPAFHLTGFYQSLFPYSFPSRSGSQ